MIKVKLKHLLAQRAYEGSRITIVGLADQTGISRSTLQRIANNPEHNTTTEQLDVLCQALHCNLEELLERSEN